MVHRCHLGKVALYDTVTKLNWGVDIRTHSIREVVERLLTEDIEWADEPPPDDDNSVAQMSWPWWGSGDKDKDKDTKKKVKLPVPVAKEEVDCVVCLYFSVLVWSYSRRQDCFDWEYGKWEQ